MKLVAFFFVLRGFEVAANGFRGSSGANNVVERPHGFADVDPGEDEAFKVLKKNKHHSHDSNHRTLHKSSGGASREFQHQVEQMVNRVKHLHDREASIGFANELNALEEELGTGTADQALVEEVNSVRADLCTQPAFEDTSITACESFMEKSCSKRPLKVPSQFCTKFFRQMKHRQSHAPTEDEAVKFTANEAADASADEGAVAGKGAVDSEGAMDNEGALDNEGAVDSEGTVEAEQHSAAPGPGPAPGPAPMGVIFGGKVRRPLPDQGFDGDLSQYKDFEQQVENWQLEFGPKSGQRDYAVICADHKGNEWCRLHGFGKKRGSKTIIEEIVEVWEPGGAGSTPGAAPPGSKSNAARHNHVIALTSAFVVASVFAWA